MGWWSKSDNRAEVFAATNDARWASMEQRVARLEVEVRDIHGVVMEVRGKLAVDSHFDQMIERITAMERLSEIKANSIGKLEGRIEGVFQILAGLKEALARSSDSGVSQAAKQIVVNTNTFVSDKQGNQIGNDNQQK